MILLNFFKNFFKKNIVIKIILLLILLLVIYYFFIAGYRADEAHFMISANYVLLGLRPYIDFRGTHGEIGWYSVAFLLKSGISTEIVAIIYRIVFFVIFILLIYNLAKLFNKKSDVLVFGNGGNFDKISVILISIIISFSMTYSAMLPETVMIPLLLLGLYFLVKGGSKNHIIAGVFFALSIVALQKAIFVIPLLYILSLEKIFLKNYKKVLLSRLISGLSIIFSLFLYCILRYRGYTTNELWIVYESLFKLQGILQLPFNLYNFFTGFVNGGINNLLYLLPGIFFLFLSKRKMAITIAVYVILQLFLLSYIFHVMPLMIVRYLYAFLVLTPIFLRYKWFNKYPIIKNLTIFFVFIMSYIPILLSSQWNKIMVNGCQKAYEIFDDNQNKKIVMLYDGICFKESYNYDTTFAGKRLLLEKSLLSTYNFDIDIRLTYKVSFEKINTLPHLEKYFSSATTVETILKKYDHVYTMFSGCTTIVKIGSYEQMLADGKYTLPAISCVPLVNNIMTLFQGKISGE